MGSAQPREKPWSLEMVLSHYLDIDCQISSNAVGSLFRPSDDQASLSCEGVRTLDS